ncbi:hypothetical protein VAPA_2c08200 [Variovorax paradoxus B4]|uniref:Uncharacterized protein n=1 Tax=Variovorax paradoxus B4 TaxID=1246301 RepID=T1XLE9_VARPD|nr:hypothetical protein VAPA_2c08200 [Variovorax paradoxus B4]
MFHFPSSTEQRPPYVEQVLRAPSSPAGTQSLAPSGPKDLKNAVVCQWHVRDRMHCMQVSENPLSWSTAVSKCIRHPGEHLSSSHIAFASGTTMTRRRASCMRSLAADSETTDHTVALRQRQGYQCAAGRFELPWRHAVVRVMLAGHRISSVVRKLRVEPGMQ